MQCKVIVNPVAGRGNVGKQIPRIKSLLAQTGITYDLELTRSPGHGIELAREAAKKYPMIVAVGGDGTINEVVNGIAGSESTLGIIPAGTGNDLARSLHIPTGLEKSIKTLLTGRTIAMDIGKDIDGFFSNILGIGFPSDVMYHANTAHNFLRGSTAIKASIIQVVNKLQPYSVHIETDSKKFSATVMGIFILNTPFAGGGVMLAPAARWDDGMFDVLIMHEMGKLEFLNTLPKAYKGKHVKNRHIEIIRTTRIKIAAQLAMRKNFDGNIIGATPVQAEVLPRALKIRVP